MLKGTHSDIHKNLSKSVKCTSAIILTNQNMHPYVYACIHACTHTHTHSQTTDVPGSVGNVFAVEIFSTKLEVYLCITYKEGSFRLQSYGMGVAGCTVNRCYTKHCYTEAYSFYSVQRCILSSVLILLCPVLYAEQCHK